MLGKDYRLWKFSIVCFIGVRYSRVLFIKFKNYVTTRVIYVSMNNDCSINWSYFFI